MLGYQDTAGVVQAHDPRRRHRPPSAAPGTALIGAGLLAILDLAFRTWAALRRAHGRRKTIRALSALDNRALADIGVYRGEIPAVAEAAADGYGPRSPTTRRPR